MTSDVPPKNLGSDDWDRHWTTYGVALEENPANDYRNHLVLTHIGTPQSGDVIVDFGAGQGEMALLLQHRFADASVLGLEESPEGVARAQAAAAASGSNAQFQVCDLLTAPASPPTTNARFGVCSEVLEHVDDPVTLLRNAALHLAPGALIVVTVPGGPRSAFDRHIGHRDHFTTKRLRSILVDAGFSPEGVWAAGFPFFNLYKLAIIAQVQRFVEGLEASPDAPSRLQTIGSKIFKLAFKANLTKTPLGWQMLAVARKSGGD
jgi:SAM-dependent methyltransferase